MAYNSIIFFFFFFFLYLHYYCFVGHCCNFLLQRDCPPQCPPRPVSYTPSSNNEQQQVLLGCTNSAAVALNNLDTLRSYGSAGDELENFPPDYLRNLNRNNTVHNTPATATMADLVPALEKPCWQEQIQLASFISDSTKIKNGKETREHHTSSFLNNKQKLSLLNSFKL